MNRHTDYESESQAIRAENTEVLEAFESWLNRKKLSESTVKKHRGNIDFYINEFLLYEEPKRPAEGVDEVRFFLGHWFIRKAMWANETSIRSNAASLKKFYDFMAERGHVTPVAVKELKEVIKEQLPDWVETVKRYDDPSVDLEDVWRW
ncbi:recombinase [Aquisalimonas sp.]|uniref:recombinase n=1 Tax=Aquisalimonas sp. TaxID=1872621 RepID=UPI0025C01C9A|nr:recombinase [Aquisalimonas sp.]